MQNIKVFLLLFFIIPLLIGCSFFQAEEQGNLINFDTLNEGSWIGFTGDYNSNSEYIYTESIDYNPSNNYSINRNAYVTYYNDDEFIKTVQHPGGNPIDTEKDANNIKISFNQDRIESIELVRE